MLTIREGRTKFVFLRAAKYYRYCLYSLLLHIYAMPILSIYQMNNATGWEKEETVWIRFW